MEKKFSRKKSALDIIISLVFIVAGAIALSLRTDVWVGIGIVLLVFGITFWFALKSSYKLPGDKRSYSKKIYNFKSDQSEMLRKALSGSGKLNLKEEGKGNMIMLYLYRSKDGTQAYAQSFGFSDYRYQPTSELVSIAPDAIVES